VVGGRHDQRQARNDAKDLAHGARAFSVAMMPTARWP
jgi:hypothetical protein